MPVSFIHCGDIHLGYNQYNQEERFKDFHKTFSDIVDYAIKEEVNYFLITGDFFNKRSINSRTLSQAMQELGRLKENAIPVIAIEGNHDKAPYGEVQSWMQFLNERGYLYLLSPDFEDGFYRLKPYQENKKGSLLAFADIRFIGLGYQGSMMARRLAELDEQLEGSQQPTILLMHSAIDMLMHLGGTKLQDIAMLRDRIDYVAMGHIHQCYELQDWIYNPGAPESWDLGEGDKKKGFYHVVFDGDEKRVVHIPSIKRPIHQLVINLSGCRSVEEVYVLCDRELDKLVKQEGTKPMVQMVITGMSVFSPLAIEPRVLEEKAERVLAPLVVEIVNRAVLQGEDWQDADSPVDMNRDELERDVLRRLFEAKGKFDYWIDDLVDLSKVVKELIHQEAEDQAISVLVEGLAERIIEQGGEHLDKESTVENENGERQGSANENL